MNRLMVCLMCLFATSVFAGEVPGTYAYYGFGSPPNGFDALEFRIQVNNAAGSASKVRWANKFRFVGSQLEGYAGIQTRGDKRSVFVFSVNHSNQSKLGSAGGKCHQSGSGQTCEIDVPWNEKVQYRFDIKYEKGEWLRVIVTDLNNKKWVNVGSIKVNAALLSPDGIESWVTYMEGSSGRSTCFGQPHSEAVFYLPIGKLKGKKHTANITSYKTRSSCQEFSKVTEYEKGSLHENGIGNSVRGPIQNAEHCLDVERGLAEGNAMIMYPCHGRDNQSWVFSKDSTIQAPYSYCVLNKGKLIAGRCAPLDRYTHWLLDGALIKHKVTGKCLTEHGYHKQVTLEPCDGSSNQQWRTIW